MPRTLLLHIGVLKTIGGAYRALWGGVIGLAEWASDAAEKSKSTVLTIGAALGVLWIEWLYFTSAEQVRLLFVLLLAPLGAGIGALLTLLLAGCLGAIASVVVFGVALFISVAPVVAIIYFIIRLLYSIVVWRN